MVTHLLLFSLSGKVAVVTGAAGLLGKQHCLALAEGGAKVIVTDINLTAIEAAIAEMEKEVPGTYEAMVMDVTDESSISRCLATVLQRFGKVDVLINNAAIDPKVKQENTLLEKSRFENFELDNWNFQLNVGLTGAMLCSKFFGSHMATKGCGVILNLASDLSVFSPDQRIYRKDGLPPERQPVKPVTYSVIKHGLIGLTKYLATYWAPQGVRVNALSPGGVFNDQPEAFVNKLSQLIPLGRMANKDEYRSAIQFLCSDASSYMTGQNIVMDGGRSVW
jgi:NAD(P)-dependent dehydrogenase (short-subunit alcohol dehydrogenase family)